MPLEQFLTGSTLPWLRPEDQNGAEITRGANLASSFMENSMRQQEMQQKAQMNPIAVRVAQQDEKLKGLQIAHGLFMQQELIDHKATEAELAAGAQELRDQGKAGDPAAWLGLGAKISGRNPGVWNDTTFKAGFEEAKQNQTILNNLKIGEEKVGILGLNAATAEEAVQNLKAAKEATDARLREKEAGWEKAQADHDATKLQVKALELHEKLTNGDGKDGIGQIERRALMGQISALNSAIRDKTITLEDGTRKMQTLERQYSEKAKSRLSIPAAGSDTPAATPQTFQNGEVRRQNGKTYQFDGSKWNPIP